MNEELFEFLRNEDVEVDDALERLSGDQEMYVRLLNSFFAADQLIQAREAFAKDDKKAAFLTLHNFKGASLNLGLLNLADPCIEIVQYLREGKYAEAKFLLPSFEEKVKEFSSRIAPYLKEGKQ